jgi:hypothetical protein
MKLLNFIIDCVAGLGLANPAWSLPTLVTSLLCHARKIFYACMNSEKVIKLPSHCSSPFLLCENETKEKTKCCNWWFPVLVSLYFLFVFYILTCIISFCRNWERQRTHLVLRRKRRWWCCVLYFIVSSASVRFASSSLPFAFSLFLRSLNFLTFS